MNTNKTTKKPATKKAIDKKAAKSAKYAFVVNLADAETVQDVALMFAKAKFDAKVPLNKTDINAFIEDRKNEIMISTKELISMISTLFTNLGIFTCDCKCKKQNIFKHFWKWLTGRK